MYFLKLFPGIVTMLHSC